jgi:two-component system sensor histidine kinase/response regulator
MGSNGGGVLDSAAIENLREMGGGDMDFVADLIVTFLEDAPGLLAHLRHAIYENAPGDARLYAHSLKGNALDFGAMHFAELCRQMEMLGKSGDLNGSAALMAQIDAAYDEAQSALRDLAGG